MDDFMIESVFSACTACERSGKISRSSLRSMTTESRTNNTFLVLVQTSSAAAIYVIPHACHLDTCSDSYIWQNLCWGNCKYV